MSDHRLPQTPIQWFVFVWAVGGVVATLLQALVRLTPRAMSLIHFQLEPWHMLALVGFAGFMLYAEAYRGFHLQFNPRVIVRACGLGRRLTVFRFLFAPLVVMGLFYGTRRRLLVSRILIVGIVLLVIGVRWLPTPWREIVDVGVVIGLGAGLWSLLGFAAGALMGRLPSVSPEFPEGT